MNSITMFRGDSRQLTINISDNNGDPFDASAYSVNFTVKKSYADSTPALHITDGSQIDMSAAATGQIIINILPENTISLAPGNYVFDCELSLSTNVYTVVADKFILKPDVTHNLPDD